MKPPRGFKADRALSHVDIERIALRRRRLLAPGRRLDEPLACAEIFEHIDDFGVTSSRGELRLDYGTANLPGSAEGQTRFIPETKRILIELHEGTYKDLSNGGRRPRMTVLHELGHADLHTEMLLRMSTIPHHVMALKRAASPPHPFYLDTEWQSDAYAAAVLMPAKAIAYLERRYGRRFGAAVLQRVCTGWEGPRPPCCSSSNADKNFERATLLRPGHGARVGIRLHCRVHRLVPR